LQKIDNFIKGRIHEKNMTENRVRSSHEKIMGVKLLQHLTTEYGALTELAEELGMSIASISRYKANKILPNSKLIDKIVNYWDEKNTLEAIIKNRIKTSIIGRDTHIDNTKLQSDNELLRIISFYIGKKYLATIKADIVVTTEVDGIPFCIALGNELGIPSIYSRRKKPTNTESYSIDVPKASSRIDTIYIPKDLIKKGQKCIVVDDLIRTGNTNSALTKLINERVEGEVVAEIVLIGVGEQWKSKESLRKIPIQVMYQVKEEGELITKRQRWEY
jgi:adenine phosphoribosyltransferase